MAFDRATGALRWEHHGNCTGGGEATPALHAGRMYPLGDNPAIYDATTGAPWRARPASGRAGVRRRRRLLLRPTGGVFASTPRIGRALGGGVGANARPPLLSATTLSTSAPRTATWPPSRAPTAPCAGARHPGEPVVGSTGNVDRPDSGLGAGDGFLVVPAGGSLIAYGPGGVAAPLCANIAVTPPPPALTIDDRRAHRRAGARGPDIPARCRERSFSPMSGVEIQGDAWPFDGRWQPVASA